MKKIFKKTVKFLFDTTLIAIMLVSAQHVMNLPLGWACFGYIAIFGATLTVWTNKHCEEYYKEGIETGIKVCLTSAKIYNYASNGEDEFTITAPNEVIFNTDIKFLMKNIVVSPVNDYKYKVASMNNHGTETEVTFTKIKD